MISRRQLGDLPSVNQSLGIPLRAPESQLENMLDATASILAPASPQVRSSRVHVGTTSLLLQAHRLQQRPEARLRVQ